MKKVLLPLFAAALLAAGCSGATGGPRTDPTVITQAQIQETGARSVLEVIERLRPRWLQQRFPRSERLATETMVYQNRALLGGIDVLRELDPQGIYSIRWLDAAQAGRLPGAGSTAVAGAIILSTSPEQEIR